MTSLLTDEAIAVQVQEGNTSAFGLLVERFEAKMIRYGRRFLFGHEDCEDLVQEIFLKAYVNMQGFDAKRRFSPWLYRIAHNEFLNAIKKKGREPVPFFDPDALFPHPISKETADGNLQKEEMKTALDRCLHELDPKYREPLVLYYFEDLDYQTIGQVLRLPVSTVGVRIKRGKAALQKIHSQIFPLHAKHA